MIHIILKTLPCGKRVYFHVEKLKLEDTIFIRQLSFIEKGKRKAVYLWGTLSESVKHDQRNKLIKNLFNLETEQQLEDLLNQVKNDFIELVIAKLKKSPINF